MSHRIRVGVLRGGPSNEYEVSLNSGANVLLYLQKYFEDLYHPRDIFIDKRGDVYFEGVPIDLNDLHSKVDVIFNALHGAYGEDGKIQMFMEAHGVPFTGSGSLASAMGMNKIMTKRVLSNHNIKSPHWKEIESDIIRDDVEGVVKDLFNSFVLPAIVKPVSGGSSIGVSIVRNFNEMGRALTMASTYGDSVLVEEFISGTEATCGVIEHFRGHDIYALPPIEIRSDNTFFDYEAKYGGKSKEIVPATFSESIKREVEELAKAVHKSLGLRHYSRTDFIIHPRRGVYVLETNTLPGLTEESLFPKSLRAVGSDTHELIGHIIKLALGNREER